MQEYTVYAIGQRALLEGFNVNATTGEPETPTDPMILLKPPTGPEESLAITENPTGHFYHVLSTRTRAAGKYYYRIVTADDALDRFFVIAPTAFAAPFGP